MNGTMYLHILRHWRQGDSPSDMSSWIRRECFYIRPHMSMDSVIVGIRRHLRLMETMKGWERIERSVFVMCQNLQEIVLELPVGALWAAEQSDLQ